jgi:hypothetical protein
MTTRQGESKAIDEGGATNISSQPTVKESPS